MISFRVIEFVILMKFLEYWMENIEMLWFTMYFNGHPLMNRKFQKNPSKKIAKNDHCISIYTFKMPMYKGWDGIQTYSSGFAGPQCVHLDELSGEKYGVLIIFY